MNSQQRGIARLSVIILSACAVLRIASAQPAANQASPVPKAVQASHAGDASKPQVVYNVPSRQTAEALHAQSKSVGDLSLPIDANMPLSLQLSRSKANAEATPLPVAEAPPTEARVSRRGKKRNAGSVAPIAPTRGGSKPSTAVPAHGGQGASHGHGHGKHRGGN